MKFFKYFYQINWFFIEVDLVLVLPRFGWESMWFNPTSICHDDFGDRTTEECAPKHAHHRHFHMLNEVNWASVSLFCVRILRHLCPWAKISTHNTQKIPEHTFCTHIEMRIRCFNFSYYFFFFFFFFCFSYSCSVLYGGKIERHNVFDVYLSMRTRLSTSLCCYPRACTDRTKANRTILPTTNTPWTEWKKKTHEEKSSFHTIFSYKTIFFDSTN